MSAEKLSPEQKRQAEAFVCAVLFKPWRAFAQGPDAFDCWGLARATQLALAGRDLPLVNANPADLRNVVRIIRDHPLHETWVQVDAPRHLDVVLLAHRKEASHIGVWLALDGGGVLHATQQFTAGTVPAPDKPSVGFDNLHALRLAGWSHFRFMRHKEAA